MRTNTFKFSTVDIEDVFGTDPKQPTYFMFRSESDKDAPFMAVFEEAAWVNKGKGLFTYSDVSSGLQARLGALMDVTEFDLPVMKAVNHANLEKYKSETPPAFLTVESMTEFIDNVKGRLIK